MKIYILSRTVDGEIQTPQASSGKEPLIAEMNRQHDKIIKEAGHHANDIGILDNGDLVAYYGTYRHVWRIDEVDI